MKNTISPLNPETVIVTKIAAIRFKEDQLRKDRREKKSTIDSIDEQLDRIEELSEEEGIDQDNLLKLQRRTVELEFDIEIINEELKILGFEFERLLKEGFKNADFTNLVIC